MAGHNKWKQIKHQKGVEDAKKSRAFSKFARLITLESKKVAGNVNAPGLRSAIERARAVNMPNANIERAVKRGLEKDAVFLEEVLYEAYGPGGSALVISGLTDNKNRTAQEIKHMLSLHGSSLAEQGAASWAFKKENNGWTPQTTVPLDEESKKALATIIEELENRDDIQNVFTNAV